MNQEEFKKELAEILKKNLYERDKEVEISFRTVEKMNQTYEAITITPSGNNVGINMNLEAFENAYRSGTSFQQIADKITDQVEEHLSNMPVFDVSQITDYEKMKEKLAMEVVAFDRNTELLSKVPHKQIEDMAVVYRFVVDTQGKERGTILITNHLLEKMQITKEQLQEDALKNAPQLRPVVLKGMSEMMVELMGEEFQELMGEQDLPQDEKMYVATVPDRVSGAGVLAYQEFMDEAAQKLGGDFFILPSSIHEILLVKDDGNANFKDLKAMVEEVNATQVLPEEKLTDSVYHYDSKEHIFELAEKFESRKKGLEKQEKPKAKESVLEDLVKKKDEIARHPVKKEVEKVGKEKGGDFL